MSAPDPSSTRRAPRAGGSTALRWSALFVLAAIGMGCPEAPSPPVDDDDSSDGGDQAFDDDDSSDDDDSATARPLVPVCSGSWQVEVGAWFDVGMSYSPYPLDDPDPPPFDVSWTVTGPTGEGVEQTVSESTGWPRGYPARTPGPYRAVGVAVAPDGGVLFCDIVVPAVVTQALYVTARWDTGGDVDLHFVRHGGAWLSPDDCYFSNCSSFSSDWRLDWGEPGNELDDPLRGDDAVFAPGREHVGVPDPSYAPGDSPYAIGLHYWGSPPYQDQGPVTIAVWIDGAPVAEFDVPAPLDTDFVCAGTIDWASGTVSLGPEGCPDQG